MNKKINCYLKVGRETPGCLAIQEVFKYLNPGLVATSP